MCSFGSIVNLNRMIQYGVVCVVKEDAVWTCEGEKTTWLLRKDSLPPDNAV